MLLLLRLVRLRYYDQASLLLLILRPLPRVGEELQLDYDLPMVASCDLFAPRPSSTVNVTPVP